MKRFLVALILLGTVLLARAEIVTVPIPGAPGLSITVGTGANALPLTDIRSNPAATNITMGDDEFRHVPLSYNFTLFGKTFNNSWMMSNGVVAFQDPNVTGAGGLCCSGVDLRTTTDPRFNYSIMPLWSDLYAHSPNSHYVLNEATSTTYGWYNVSQCCSSEGGNSFEVKINSAGLIDTRIAGALVNYNAVTSGMTGDLSKGEYYQYYHGPGISIPMGSAGAFSWQALSGTGTDICSASPLTSPSCPGYTEAMCAANPLYSATCSGYQTAYLIQQCAANPLYNTTCPGYAAAYLTYQCSMDPLYSTTCEGYERAYHDQQCSISPLYASDCAGYTQAYHSQQCSISPLYATDCVGYAQAYHSQQCRLSPLFATDCPGYEQAYLNAQCIKDSLYSTQCEGYKTAYAIKYLVGLSPTVTTAVSSALTDIVETQRNDPANTTGAVDAISAQTSSTTTPSATTSATSVSPVAVISTIKPAPAPTATMAQADPKKEEPKKADGNNNGPVSNNESKPADKPKTNREVIAERRAEAAKKEAVAKASNLANDMGKAADMEAQKAIQNVVIQAMGFTPGFDAYNKAMIPDTTFYKPYTVYGNQKNVDNQNISKRLMGGSEVTHQLMVDSQYNLGK